MKKSNLHLLLLFILAPVFSFGQCISNVNLQQGDCEPGGIYQLDVWFTVDDPSIDSVDINYDGIYFGSHAVANLPITLYPLFDDGNMHTVEVVNSNDANCSGTETYFAFCNYECTSDIHMVNTFCSDSNLSFILNYTFTNPLSEVHILINDEYITNGIVGQNVTQTISIPSDPNTFSYEIVVIDPEFTTCGDTLFWQVGPCQDECVTGFETDTNCQPNGGYNFVISFPEYEDNINVYFDGEPHGVASTDSVSTYTFSNLSNDGIPHEVTLCFKNDPTCCTTFNFDDVDCSPVCEAEIVNVIPVCEGQLPAFEVTYNNSNPQSTTKFYVNDLYVADAVEGENNQIFLNPQLFIEDGFYHIEMKDPVTNTCQEFFTVGPFFCDCLFPVELNNSNTTCLSDSTYQLNALFESADPNQNYYIIAPNSTTQYGPYTGSPNSGNFIAAELILPIESVGQFTIYESQNSLCSSNFMVDVDCSNTAGCEIDILHVEFECNIEGLFFTIEYNALNILTEAHMFLNGEYINNVNEGSNMVTSIYVNEPGSTDSYVLEIRDAEFLSCGDIMDIGEINCDPCPIISNSFSYDCKDNGTYTFTFENRDANPVEVFLDSVSIGTHTTGTPDIVVENLSAEFPGSTVEVLICSEEFACCVSRSFNIPECVVQDSCEFAYLQLGENICNDDGTYNTTAFFEIANYQSNMVAVYVNNSFIGNQVYTNNGLALNNISPRTNSNSDIVKICSTIDESCCMELEFTAPDCTEEIPCTITNVLVEHDCLNTEEFVALIYFNYDQTYGDTVKISDYANNLIGYFDASIQPIQIPQVIVPSEQNVFGVIIENPSIPNCIIETEIREVNCSFFECQINIDENYEIDCNDDGTYNLTLSYNVFNSNSDFLIVKVNGEVSDSVLITPNQAFTVNNIVSNANDDFDNISICVGSSADCCAGIDILQPSCEPITPCVITNLDAVAVCSIDSPTFDIVLSYEYEGSSNQVEVFINGDSYGIWAAQFPSIDLGPFSNINSPDFNIEVRDVNTSILCSDSTFLAAPMCEEFVPCTLDFIQSDSVVCNSDGSYNVNIFYGNGGSSPNNLVEVFVNNELLDVFADNGVIELSNITARPNSEFDIITICLVDNAECCLSYEYFVPECGPQECSIRDLFFNKQCEGDSLYYLWVDFIAENTSGIINVSNNGMSLGTFNVADKPYMVGPFANSNDHNIKVIDVQDESCFAEVEFFEEGCGSSTELCAIQYIELDSLVCNGDGTFNMTAYYGLENAGNSFIDVFLNGNLFESFNIGNQVTLNNVPLSPTNDVKTITICVNDNPDCCKTVEYSQPSCETSDCSIRDLTYDYECENDSMYYIVIDYIAENTSGTVQISDLGIPMGTFDIANKPHLIGPYFTENGHYIQVRDVQDETCVGDIEFGGESCLPDTVLCEIAYIEIDSLVCNGDNTFDMIAYFGVQNADNAFIDVYLNGELYDADQLASQVILSNIPISLTTDIKTITICVQDNPNCCKTVDYQQPDCEDPVDCSIDDLEVVTECDDFGKVYFSLYYELNNADGSEHVVVLGNGINYGTYNTTTQPIVLGPLDPGSQDDWEFVVRDSFNLNCQAVFELGEVECEDTMECFIDNVKVETECDSLVGAYFYVYYDAENTSGEVNISGNGENYGFYGANQQPAVIGPLDPSSNDEWEFVVSDSQNDNCQAFVELGAVDCSDTNEIPCVIENIEIFNIECIGDNEYSMSVDFDVAPGATVPFTFYINGELINSASTSTLPLNVFGAIANDSTELEYIKICIETSNDFCCVEQGFEKPACLTDHVDYTLIDDVVLSPNPTRDLIHISNIPNQVIGIHIIDNLGRSLAQKSASEMMQFDVSDYAEGIYMVQFFTADNRVMNKRFVKMN